MTALFNNNTTTTLLNFIFHVMKGTVDFRAPELLVLQLRGSIISRGRKPHYRYLESYKPLPKDRSAITLKVWLIYTDSLSRHPISKMLAIRLSYALTSKVTRSLAHFPVYRATLNHLPLESSSNRRRMGSNIWPISGSRHLTHLPRAY